MVADIIHQLLYEILEEFLMIILIDTDCKAVPTDSKPLPGTASTLLNLLLALEYDPASPPLAALLKGLHGLEGDWAVVSPVLWQATHNDVLILAAGDSLDLKPDEAAQCFAMLADFFSTDGMTMYYHSPGTWLVNLANKPRLQAKPVHQLLNSSLMPQLAALDASLYWQKVHTECQMLFASVSNQSQINGVWIWGNGALTPRPTTTIYAAKSFLQVAESSQAKAVLYDPALPLKDCDLLLLDNLSELSPSHQHELGKLATSWYWKNTAYQQVPQNSLQRLWRKLFHAD